MPTYCSNTFKSIPYDCEASKGGVVEAYVSNFADGLYTISADTSGNPQITAVSAGTTWYKLLFKRNVSNATQTLNVDAPNGVRYVETILSLQFNRQDTVKRAAVAALALGGAAVIYKDANGHYWALGVENPVEPNGGTGNTGTAATDGNNYIIELKDEQSDWLYEVSYEAIQSLNFAE